MSDTTTRMIGATDLQPGDFLWRTPATDSIPVVNVQRLGATVVVNGDARTGYADAWLAVGTVVTVTRRAA